MSSLNLYFDRFPGSRHPDKKADKNRRGAGLVRSRWISNPTGRWTSGQITSPSYCGQMAREGSVPYDGYALKQKGFFLVGALGQTKSKTDFGSDYKGMLARVPVIGIACVIDRPGYVARGYLEKYPDKWLLCRSAFDILIERSAKFAKMKIENYEVIHEGDVGTNEVMKSYFRNIKQNGMAFDGTRSSRYKPLPKEEFGSILTTIEYKTKESPLMQIADSYVYAMARAASRRSITLTAVSGTLADWQTLYCRTIS